MEVFSLSLLALRLLALVLVVIGLLQAVANVLETFTSNHSS